MLDVDFEALEAAEDMVTCCWSDFVAGMIALELELGPFSGPSGPKGRETGTGPPELSLFPKYLSF